jgi:hypothetical protein
VLHRRTGADHFFRPTADGVSQQRASYHSGELALRRVIDKWHE